MNYNNVKGVYLWNRKSLRNGDAKAIAAEFVRAGVGLVAVKINDGNYVYPDLADLFATLRSEGISVGAWGYIYLKWNPLAEANAAIKNCGFLEPDFYLIDAEGHAKWQWVGAKIFASRLKSGLDKLGIPIGMNSYWKPSLHPELPWKELRNVCSFDCPQVYWRGSFPVEKLRKSKMEYSMMTPKLPMLLVAGDLYREHGIEPTPEQVIQFLDEVKKDPEINGTLMWAADQCETTPKLWAAFAGYDSFPTSETPLYFAVATTGLNIRGGPGVSYPKVGLLRQGDRINVWDIKITDRTWLKIDSNLSQWVAGEFTRKV